MDELKPTPASEFKKAFRKLHRLPSGRVVEIRRLAPEDFAGLSERMAELAELKGLSPEELSRKAAEDRAIFDFGLQAAGIIITRGVVRPKISMKKLSELEDDEVHISDLGDDGEDLVRAILTFSGVTLP